MSTMSNEVIINEQPVNSEEELLSRHRKERKEIQSKITFLKKSSAKADKKKKREVTEEIARLEIDLERRQNEELLTFKELCGITELTQNLVLQPEGVSLSNSADDKDQQQSQRISKAQKRRDKKATKSKEREEQIKAQDAENVFGSRNVETQKIKQILKERNLMIQEIPSDGNCLYCALDFQWQLLHGKLIGLEKLRSATSEHLRANISDFLPFITHPVTDDLLTEEQYEEYCQQVASTSAWGGEVELRALSHVLKSSIEVIQATGPSVVIGEEFKDSERVTLTYHRHMYGLGEHYNSVRPYEEPKEDDVLDVPQHTGIP